MTGTTLERTPTASTVSWHRVCPVDGLEQGWGEAALIAGRQVALFHLGDHELYAVSHRDPATGANVMARGLTGSRSVDGAHLSTITSPLHKEVYDLASGTCLTAPELRLRTYPTRLVDGHIEVGIDA